MSRRAPTPLRSTPSSAPLEGMIQKQQAHIEDLVHQNRKLEETITHLKKNVAEEEGRGKEAVAAMHLRWKQERSEWQVGCDALQAAHRLAHLRTAAELDHERAVVVLERAETGRERLARLQRDYRLVAFQRREVELESRICQLEREAEDLRAQHAEQSQGLSEEFENKAHGLEAQCADLLEQLRDKAIEIHSTMKDKEAVEDALAKLRAEHTALVASSSTTATKLERTALHLDGLKSSFSELEAKHSEAERTVAELRRQLEKWRNLENREGAEIETLRRQRIELEVRVKEAETRAEEAAAKATDREEIAEKAKKKTEKYKAALDEYRKAIEEAQDAAERAEAEVDEWKDRLAKAEEEVDALKAQMKASEGEQGDSTGQLAKAEEEIVSLKAQLQAEKEKYAQTRASEERLEQSHVRRPANKLRMDPVSDVEEVVISASYSTSRSPQRKTTEPSFSKTATGSKAPTKNIAHDEISDVEEIVEVEKLTSGRAERAAASPKLAKRPKEKNKLKSTEEQSGRGRAKQKEAPSSTSEAEIVEPEPRPKPKPKADRKGKRKADVLEDEPVEKRPAPKKSRKQVVPEEEEGSDGKGGANGAEGSERDEGPLRKTKPKSKEKSTHGVVSGSKSPPKPKNKRPQAQAKKGVSDQAPLQGNSDNEQATPKKKKRKINLFPTAQPTSFAWDQLAQTDGGLNIPTELSPVKEPEGTVSGTMLGRTGSGFGSFGSRR
ncbi:uncharacterized protein FIBRA_03459 [Fibroporia radiculosa]|uniref:Uncharacterized protein n=1 Tax=Fibroporia radiculosa TaxID=599839 RepID=J4G5K1_9APHY|nr:uncharacterized protein FIBRA_03459 [Fibroporia radiculosa]CCM01408.1 predicted protein [Fibroporia radiculosa]